MIMADDNLVQEAEEVFFDILHSSLVMRNLEFLFKMIYVSLIPLSCHKLFITVKQNSGFPKDVGFLLLFLENHNLA